MRASEPPTDPPRLDVHNDPRLKLTSHLRENSPFVLAVAFLTAVTGIATGMALVPKRIELELISASITGILVALFVAWTYLWHIESVNKDNRLYLHGVAQKATVCYVGLDNDCSEDGQATERYAWIVRWKYSINGTVYKGASPLAQMMGAQNGDQIWILFDVDNPSTARRWDAFLKCGPSKNHHLVDQIKYVSPCPRHPKSNQVSSDSNV